MVEFMIFYDEIYDLVSRGFAEKKVEKHNHKKKKKHSKKSFGGIPNSRNVLFLEIFLKRAAKPSAGNPVLTWPCTKDSQSATFSGPR